MANLYNHIAVIPLGSATDDQFANQKTGLAKAMSVSQPMFYDARKNSETKTHQAAIREATTYANFSQTQKAYINKARGRGVTAYYTAIADWFCAPKVLEIDVDD